MFNPFKLKSTLGRSYNVDLDDSFRTKKVLKKLDLFEIPSYGITEFPDEPLFRGIEKFQERYGLTRDGIMKPDGETAKKLRQVLAEKDSFDSQLIPNALGLTADIGPDRKNRPHDVFSVAKALDWAGYPLAQNGVNRSEGIPAAVPDAVKRFQRDAGLIVDGWLRPYGQTEKALNNELQSKVQSLKVFVKSHNDGEKSESPSSDSDNQQAFAPAAIPHIVYKIAEFFGIAVMAAWAWWQSMDAVQQEKIKKQITGRHSGGGREEQCDYLHYQVDRPRCVAVGKKYGNQAAQRCYASANERYAACLKGVPLDQLPPLDVWNH